jgi:hypothetical protein
MWQSGDTQACNHAGAYQATNPLTLLFGPPLFIHFMFIPSIPRHENRNRQQDSGAWCNGSVGALPDLEIWPLHGCYGPATRALGELAGTLLQRVRGSGEASRTAPVHADRRYIVSETRVRGGQREGLIGLGLIQFELIELKLIREGHNGEFRSI